MDQPDPETRYHDQLAGSSLGRLAGISDGIFAVGMTLRSASSGSASRRS